MGMRGLNSSIARPAWFRLSLFFFRLMVLWRSICALTSGARKIQERVFSTGSQFVWAAGWWLAGWVRTDHIPAERLSLSLYQWPATQPRTFEATVAMLWRPGNTKRAGVWQHQINQLSIVFKFPMKSCSEPFCVGRAFRASSSMNPVEGPANSF
jgi:hypothetical protein